VHYAWIILSLCFATLFVNYTVRLGYGVVLPEMIRTLGLSRTEAGSIFNAYLLTYIALAPVAGYLTDRLGARRVITVCILLVGAGAGLLATVNALWTACLFFGLAGLGSTGIWVPIITLIQRWFAARRRGLALGVLSTGYGLGFACLGLVFPFLVERTSWRAAWVALGAMAVALVLPNALLLSSDPADRGAAPWGEDGAAAAPAAPGGRVTLKWILRTPNFWIIGASYFSIAYGLYGVTTFMVDYARDGLGLPLEQASLLATVHGIFQVVGVLTVVPASDRFGRQATVVASNTAIALIIAALLAAGGFAPVVALIALLAVFYGATFPIYAACAGDYFPRSAMGTVAGAWTPFYGLGAIATHWVTGWLRDAGGAYTAGFAICAASAAAAALLMVFVRRPRER
jgi:sugar phosphate permease